MKIRSIEPIAVSLPMKKPVKMAGEEITRADNMLVRIEADNGVVGWGEAAAAPTMTGETVASMMAAADLMAPSLLQRTADDIAGACAAMDAQMYGNTGAKAAIEMALYDLLGRAADRPLHALLGDEEAQPHAAPRRDRHRQGRRRRHPRGEREARRRLHRLQDQGRRRRPGCRCRPHAAHLRRARPRPLAFGRRQSGFQRRRSGALRARGRRQRARFLRAAGQRA